MPGQGFSGKQTDFGGEANFYRCRKLSELSPELVMYLYCTKLKE
jgi:hypothetical protein